MTRVAVIGPGRLGEALLSGMLRAGLAPTDAAVVVRRAERGDQLAAAHGVHVMSALEAAEFADVLLIAVKPQDV
jgi:pyrroline-5-carboxylate reductase